MARPHYPRMMFHRTKPPVTVHSWAEEYALGAGWRRTVWPPAGEQRAVIPAPELSAASAVPEKDAAPGEGDNPGAPHPGVIISAEPLTAADVQRAKELAKAHPEYYSEPPNDELEAAAKAYPEWERLRKAKLAAKPEPEPPPKRQRAPTVKPTGKPKKKSRDW